LTVEKAAILGAYAQALARHLMLDRPRAPSLDVYRVYSFNRFTACRYGLEAGFIDAWSRTRRALKEDIAETLLRLAPHAQALGSAAALEEIRRYNESGENDASWLRAELKSAKTLNDVVRRQSQLWVGGAKSAAQPAAQ
jgi:carboxylate-amine ligase